MKGSEFECLNVHPQPTECTIALVLTYNDLYIAYNGFGQRIGAKAFPDIEHHMVFYSSDAIVVADNDCWTTTYNPDFTEKAGAKTEKIDRFFVDPVFERSITVFGNTLFKHHQGAIYTFFELLVHHWEDLERLELTDKYQKENILDMIAICELFHFELISSGIIVRFTKRIEQQLLRDLYVEGGSNFKSVSDMLYDEVHSWPIMQRVNSVVWN
jgi:hypothetical protein